MNRIFCIGAGLLMVFLTSCGGSDSLSNFEQAVMNSGNAFDDLLDSEPLWDCISEAVTDTTCDCPGGGTMAVSFDGARETYTAADCQDSAGRTFVGTVVTDDDGNTLTVDFPTFDECTSVTGYSIANEECNGTVTGTCAGTTETCTIYGSGDDCSYTCS